MSEIETAPTAAKTKQETVRTLSVQARLECARATVVVLRTLEILDAKIRYQELAKVIGLIPAGGAWKAWHKTQISQILAVVSASEKHGGAGDSPLQFERIVGKDGAPGKAFKKKNRVALSKSPAQDTI